MLLLLSLSYVGAFRKEEEEEEVVLFKLNVKEL